MKYNFSIIKCLCSWLIIFINFHFFLSWRTRLEYIWIVLIHRNIPIWRLIVQSYRSHCVNNMTVIVWNLLIPLLTLPQPLREHGNDVSVHIFYFNEFNAYMYYYEFFSLIFFMVTTYLCSIDKKYWKKLKLLCYWFYYEERKKKINSKRYSWQSCSVILFRLPKDPLPHASHLVRSANNS